MIELYNQNFNKFPTSPFRFLSDYSPKRWMGRSQVYINIIRNVYDLIPVFLFSYLKIRRIKFSACMGNLRISSCRHLIECTHR